MWNHDISWISKSTSVLTEPSNTGGHVAKVAPSDDRDTYNMVDSLNQVIKWVCVSECVCMYVCVIKLRDSKTK